MEEVCPPRLRTEWEGVRNKLHAYFRSFQFAKVPLGENCFFDLVPERFLMDYCRVRNRITEHVFDTYDRPDNYDFVRALVEVLDDIRYQKLNISMDGVRDIYQRLRLASSLKRFRSIARIADTTHGAPRPVA